MATKTNASRETVLLTVCLRHDQGKALGEIGKRLDQTDFRKKVPLAKLWGDDLVVEQSAWGAFPTEFYPTCDFRSVFESRRNS